MLCPQDDSSLQTLEVMSRKVASCPKCHGSFLGRSELEALAERALGDFKPAEGSAGYCPKCSTPMLGGSFAGLGLEAETCERCQGVWLAPGRLTKMLSRRAAPAARPSETSTRTAEAPTRVAQTPKPGVRNIWREPLVVGLWFCLGLALAEGLWPWVDQSLDKEAGRRRAEMAWQVRRGPELRAESEGASDPWLRGRVHYLAGEFSAALRDLDEVASCPADIREQAELALLFDLSWPEHITHWIRAPLGSKESLLVRVVDPGWGDRRTPRLEVLGLQAGSYRVLTPDWCDPQGNPREQAPVMKQVQELSRARLTDASEPDVTLAYLSGKDHVMAVLAPREGRLRAFTFISSEAVRCPRKGEVETVEGGKKQLWVWSESRFNPSGS